MLDGQCPCVYLKLLQISNESMVLGHLDLHGLNSWVLAIALPFLIPTLAFLSLAPTARV